MKVNLTKEESEKYFHSALCDGINTLEMSGVGVITKDKDYLEAYEKLEKEKPGTAICIEDAWMEILRMGKKLYLKDYEGDGDNDAEIELKDVHERVQKTPIRQLMNMINESYDGIDADSILQQVFLNDVIFG